MENAIMKLYTVMCKCASAVMKEGHFIGGGAEISNSVFKYLNTITLF